MSETETKTVGVQDKVIFLLGAGASIDAEIPDTVGMVQTFKQEALPGLEETSRSCFTAVSEKLRAHLEGQGLQLDIERLLEALEQLQHRDRAPLSPFIAGWANELAEFGPEDFQSLSRELRAHLRRKCDVPLRKTEYLRPLRDFVEGQGNLDVFSLNYDMCVEQVCHFYDIPYTDGFSATWDPELFEAPRFKVRLHKIHGSVSWFRTGELKSRLVRAPLSASVMASQTPTEKVSYFTGVDLHEVLVYPVIAKETHVDPHATLLARFRAASRRSRFLIVIGCSFRDEYVRGVVYEAMAQNRELQLIVVSPDANPVYRTPQEKYYLCDFAERVLPLADSAKDALAGSHLYRLIGDLRETLRFVRSSDDQLREKGFVDGKTKSDLARSLARISHDELVSVVVPKYDTLESYLPQLGTEDERARVAPLLESAFNLAFIQWLRAQKERADRQQARFWVDLTRQLSILVAKAAYVPGVFPANHQLWIPEPLIRETAPLVTGFDPIGVELGVVEELCSAASRGLGKARLSVELEFPEAPATELAALESWFETLARQHSDVWESIVRHVPQLSEWRKGRIYAQPMRPWQDNVQLYANASSSARQVLSKVQTPWAILDSMRERLG